MTHFSNLRHKSECLNNLARELDNTSVISDHFKMTLWLYATGAFQDAVEITKEEMRLPE